MPDPGELPKSLSDWEKTLSAYCAHISSLGEIPLTPGEIDEIGRHLSALLKRTKPIDLAGAARRNRSTLITYMAAIAARNEDRGYWDALFGSLGVSNSPQLQRALGQAFEEAMTDLGLPEFADVGGYRYVTPIRLHGGIPAYSLDDFFEFVVLPAVQHPDYADLPPDKCKAALLDDSAVQLFVDSPALNYLNYGGAVAEKFFQSCREMARLWQRQGDLPSSQELGLPGYVVRTFRDFMENRLQTTAEQKRLRAPRLLLDPFSPVELYHLELPSQPVDVGAATWRYRWQIRSLNETASNRQISEKVRVRRIGYEMTTDSREISLPFAPTQLRVELWAEPPDNDSHHAEVLGRWTVNLAPPPDHPPLLAFRASNRQSVRGGQTLPADVLWLLYPISAQLEVNGGGRCTQQFSALVGDWARWRIEEWDLSKSSSLLLRNGGETWPVAIHSRGQEPRLEGGDILAAAASFDETPFYVGEPPRLWLPASIGNLEEWRVAVSSRWAAQPEMPPGDPKPLSHWVTRLVPKRDCVELPLSALLGERPKGSYILKIEGPRRGRFELRLRIWPALALTDWQPYYLPDLRGAQPVEFGVCVAPGQRVTAQPGAEGVTVAPASQPGCFRVTVASAVTEAPLFLEAEQGYDEPVRLSLNLTVARLRWMLRTDDGDSEWSAAPIQRPVDALLQSQTTHLILELPAAVWPTGRLMLIDAANAKQPLQEGFRLVVQPGQQRVHISLAEYTDTLRHYGDCPVFSFTLILNDGQIDNQLSLLYVNRTLTVEAVLLEWTDSGATRVHWEAHHRLRTRRVRIWSTWQPWFEPREYCIPDNAEVTDLTDAPGSGAFTLPESLPRGWYHVAFRTAPVWESQHAPPTPTSDSVLIQDLDPVLRLDELDREDDTSTGTFSAHFERACIFDTPKDRQNRDVEIQWMNSHFAQATPRHALALYHWLGRRDPNTQKAIRLRMYSPELLAQVLTDQTIEGFRQSYLKQFTAVTMIKAESALLILGYTARPDFVSHALRNLLKRDRAEGVTYLLEQVVIGACSEQDAQQLLSENPDFALQTLFQQPVSPPRERLIESLIPQVDSTWLVKPGDWVRSEAGWGRIKSIRLGSQDKRYFSPRHETPILDVVLRPGYQEEHISIDLGHKTITFHKTSQVYQCSKENCSGFASALRDEVTYRHNRAAHAGIGAAYRPSSNTWIYRRSMEYQKQPPSDMLT